MIVAGVDEAGRGPLAGPVTVAAVILNDEIKGLNDSKKLSEKRRLELEYLIVSQALSYSIVHIDVETIDDINILQATLLGMQKVVKNLSGEIDEVLVDGNKCPEFEIPARAIVGGDGKVAEISAASILAKNSRDRLMKSYHEKFPDYGFDRHKGDGTSYHNQQLKKFGPCPIHRKSFSPVQALLQTEMF